MCVIGAAKSEDREAGILEEILCALFGDQPVVEVEGIVGGAARTISGDEEDT